MRKKIEKGDLMAKEKLTEDMQEYMRKYMRQYRKQKPAKIAEIMARHYAKKLEVMQK